MFKVKIYFDNHYWCKFVFEFETLDEANQFVQSAIKHYIKDENNDEEMIITIEYRQKFVTSEEKENESNISD